MFVIWYALMSCRCRIARSWGEFLYRLTPARVVKRYRTFHSSYFIGHTTAIPPWWVSLKDFSFPVPEFNAQLRTTNRMESCIIRNLFGCTAREISKFIHTDSSILKSHYQNHYVVCIGICELGDSACRMHYPRRCKNDIQNKLLKHQNCKNNSELKICFWRTFFVLMPYFCI